MKLSHSLFGGPRCKKLVFIRRTNEQNDGRASKAGNDVIHQTVFSSHKTRSSKKNWLQKIIQATKMSLKTLYRRAELFLNNDWFIVISGILEFWNLPSIFI